MRNIRIKLLVVSLLVSGLCFSITQSASAAYLHLAECRSALHGDPGDNEIAQERIHFNNLGWVLTNEWHWAAYTRLSDNRIIQFVNYVQYNSHIVTGRMFCYDDNKSGQISVSEDWYG